MSDPRASHCLHLDLPRGGNAAAQLNRVMSESGSERASTSRINSATAYSNVNRDLSAMAAGSHSDHAPVSVELGRICGRDGTDDCKDGRQSEGAPTIANHRSPRTASVYTHTLRGKALSNRHSLAARAMGSHRKAGNHHPRRAGTQGEAPRRSGYLTSAIGRRCAGGPKQRSSCNDEFCKMSAIGTFRTSNPH